MLILKIVTIIIVSILVTQIAKFILRYAYTNIVGLLAKNIDSQLKTENYFEGNNNVE